MESHLKPTMRKFFNLFIVSMLFVSFSAQASCNQYRVQGQTEWQSSYSAACSVFAAALTASWNDNRLASAAGPIETACGIRVTDKVNGSWLGDSAYPIEKKTIEDCNDNLCTDTAGVVKITNFTVCYGRGNGLADCATPLSIPQPGATQCMQGCSWGVGDPVSAFRSETVTSTGLYRLSMDSSVTGLGLECGGGGESSNSPVNPQAPTPECVGSLGEVNGKPFCAGTAANPTSNDKDANLPIPTTPGNPAAGEKPASGEGSGSGGAGRTPASGNGGAAGGPAAAAGTSASGTVATPASGTQQANCGAPGQAACKIDETGTPAKLAEGVYNGKLDAYKDAAQGARDEIKGSGSGIYDGWSAFFSAPPLVTCTGMDLPTVDGVSMGKLDACGVVEGMRTVMAYIWALSALWLCLGMVKRANT